MVRGCAEDFLKWDREKASTPKTVPKISKLGRGNGGNNQNTQGHELIRNQHAALSRPHMVVRVP